MDSDIEKGEVVVIGHLLIRDADTGKTILKQRDCEKTNDKSSD